MIALPAIYIVFFLGGKSHTMIIIVSTKGMRNHFNTQMHKCTNAKALKIIVLVYTQGSVLGIKKNIPNTVSVLGILSLIPFRY
jgi:hypothetical protein